MARTIIDFNICVWHDCTGFWHQDTTGVQPAQPNGYAVGAVYSAYQTVLSFIDSNGDVAFSVEDVPCTTGTQESFEVTGTTLSGIYTARWVVNNQYDTVEIGRQEKVVLFGCSVQCAIVALAASIAEGCCAGCEEENTQKLLKAQALYSAMNLKIGEGDAASATKLYNKIVRLLNHPCNCN